MYIIIKFETIYAFILAKYEESLLIIQLADVSDLFYAPLALFLASFIGQSFTAAGGLYEDSIWRAAQYLSLALLIGHQVS